MADCEEVVYEAQVISYHTYCYFMCSLVHLYQVDRAQMNLDDLCNKLTAKESVDRVMQHWQKTRSPLVYWTREMANMAETET